jgi:chromosome partitioning protein
MIVTVVNQKGGVGKTTTAVNFSYFLSKSKRTGLLDLDPEGGTTISFGMRRDKELRLGEKCVNIFNVDVFPSHLGLFKLEMSGDVEEITKSIKRIGESYDVLVIDTPPNLGTLSLSAMLAADRILAPLTPQPLAVEAVRNLGNRLQTINKQALAFTNLSKRAVKTEVPSVRFLEVSVPQSRLFTEASRLGVPALRYEEVRSRSPKFGLFYSELVKVTLE